MEGTPNNQRPPFALAQIVGQAGEGAVGALHAVCEGGLAVSNAGDRLKVEHHTTAPVPVKGKGQAFFPGEVFCMQKVEKTLEQWRDMGIGSEAGSAGACPRFGTSVTAADSAPNRHALVRFDQSSAPLSALDEELDQLDQNER